MTTNQILAVTFPLLAAVAVWVVALFIRKPWAKRQPKVMTDNQGGSFIVDKAVFRADYEVAQTLGEVDRLIQQARKRLLSHPM